MRQAPAGAQTEPGRGLLLPAEEWVEELLVRVFAILGNLEAPERGEHGAGGRAGGDGGLSFLLAGNSMFRCATGQGPPHCVCLFRVVNQGGMLLKIFMIHTLCTTLMCCGAAANETTVN